MPKKSSPSIPVTATHHVDKRANIPTEELRDFVTEDEKAPNAILYPRDPSLDPQLVWKGKDEQDQHPLEVPAVPIYIQEKISPQAIIENVRSQAKKARPQDQMALFNDFNNITFEDLVDFYHHKQNWTNRMILGDSLLVMTSLAEKEALKGQVQMIYMDPPYGIKFGSNWQVSTRKRDVKDGKEDDLTRQPEQIKAFRDTWELGIHSYLAYLRDRLTLVRELLNESGSVFVQIGDENLHLMRCVLDEVFGSENFCQFIPFRKKLMPLGANLLEGMYDYLIWYCKDINHVKFHQIYKKSEPKYSSRWTNVEFSGIRRKLSSSEAENLQLLPQDSKVYRLVSQRAPSYSPASVYDFHFQGELFSPPTGGCWVSTKDKMKTLAYADRLEGEGENLSYIYYHNDFPLTKITNLWDDTSPSQEKKYVVQTSTSVVERCILMTTDPGDLILDPTCGSGTTAYVAEKWGRRWITIDTSRVAIALARTLIMAGRYLYYLLTDSPEGLLKETEVNIQLPPSPLPLTAGDIRRGFVYRRIPHITLKTIANNQEIDAIYEKWQSKLDPLRQKLNTLTGNNWEEWQIPREAESGRSEEAKEIHHKWWAHRHERQQEMDASIARHADTELLYDQPYEDNKRVRVSGPFTVESLSPHRVLSTEEDQPRTEQEGQAEGAASGGFETMILDNLRTAGVENTKKGERLKFTRLEPFAGTWLHAVGEYQEKEGVTKRAAVCIGPEHGTVSPDLIKDAAKEAVQGVGFDLLVVLGFAFDPHVSEEIQRYGNLTVLPARMNPDLQMGNLLLKKSGAGNLFMVFGEPDLEVKTQEDGNLTVTIKGVDIYDPTTGEIRSSSTDDIACWFIDTDYNGESFFVRHAYFTGADEPYEKLKRALRAEVDESAWSALYATTSYPFEKPSTGKIAVKVINHYGDEVLKVYPV